MERTIRVSTVGIRVNVLWSAPAQFGLGLCRSWRCSFRATKTETGEVPLFWSWDDWKTAFGPMVWPDCDLSNSGSKFGVGSLGHRAWATELVGNASRGTSRKESKLLCLRLRTPGLCFVGNDRRQQTSRYPEKLLFRGTSPLCLSEVWVLWSLRGECGFHAIPTRNSGCALYGSESPDCLREDGSGRGNYRFRYSSASRGHILRARVARAAGPRKMSCA